MLVEGTRPPSAMLQRTSGSAHSAGQRRLGPMDTCLLQRPAPPVRRLQWPPVHRLAAVLIAGCGYVWHHRIIWQ